MKTEKLNVSRPPVNYGEKERQIADDNQKEVKAQKEALPNKIGKTPTKRIHLEEAAINNPEAVQKLIGDNIQWREMKFYQRQEGGQMYIDIVDKASGNVVRTIPDTKLGEVAEKLKQFKGMNISISG